MGAEETIRDRARRAVEVVRIGRGCYAVYRNGVEYSRYGFLADAEQVARELRSVELRRLERAS